MDKLKYLDQVYLVGFYIRHNISKSQLLDEGFIAAQVKREFGISDQEFLDDLMAHLEENCK